jgi:hypothetical protein
MRSPVRALNRPQLFLGLLLSWLPVLAADAADEDTPICIKGSGSLSMTPGDCPEEEDMPGSQKASGNRSTSPKSGPTSTTPAATSTSKVGNLKEESGTIPRHRASTAPAPTGLIADTVKDIALGSDEKRSLEQFEQLVARGDGIVPDLIAVYDNSNVDSRVRWVAARALGRLPNSDSTRALLAGLGDPDGFVRVASIKALQDQRETRARPQLLKLLNDKGAVVRSAAIDALAVVGTAKDSAAIAAQLTDPDNFFKGQSLFVRAHAATALGELGGPGAVEALISVVEDPDPVLREAAEAALRKLSGLEETPAGRGGPRDRWAAWWKLNR